ncbi:MAG: NAD(P)-binding domain-containing protein [Spirosomataceae bacterium]
MKTRFDSLVRAIAPQGVQVENTQTGDLEWIGADFVLMLVGYEPDAICSNVGGIELRQPSLIPVFDPATFETNVAGLYVCGTVVAGIHTEKVFIENGRDHAAALIDHIAGQEVRQVKELIERI